ncbi:hypothetical protein ADEAN_000803200 [Angomonas deanei]|uniref:Uncharacterized protein n=1 Tax=Angomonas deanei TaxID=59799 RepID=A0A7G2CKX5_9TRYP|nr:hypothetical protein ADEAN_000803200 [Angomonas deanei]
MKCASRTVRLALSNSRPRVRCGVYRTPHTAPCALFSAVRFLQTNAGHGTDEEDVSPLEEMLLGSFPDQPPPTHNNLDKDYTVERDSTALFPESLVEEQKGQVEAELEGLVTDEDTAFYLTQAEEALADSDELFPDFLYKEEALPRPRMWTVK